MEHGDQTANVRCRVTHLQADGFGVAFVEASNEFLDFVQAIIDDLLGTKVHGERRKELRAPVDAALVWSQDGAQHDGRIINLSGTGALVEGSPCPAPESEIFIFLPGYTYAFTSTRPSEARGCSALVMHVTATTFGAQFINPSAEFRMAIDNVLRATHLGPGPAI